MLALLVRSNVSEIIIIIEGGLYISNTCYPLTSTTGFGFSHKRTCTMESEVYLELERQHSPSVVKQTAFKIRLNY